MTFRMFFLLISLEDQKHGLVLATVLIGTAVVIVVGVIAADVLTAGGAIPANPELLLATAQLIRYENLVEYSQLIFYGIICNMRSKTICLRVDKMSENTLITVVKDQDINNIVKVIKKEKIEAFVFKVNKEWNAVAIKEDINPITYMLSERLNAYTLTFYNSDFGWGCDIYYKGAKKSCFSMDYELEIPKFDPDKQTFITVLKELCSLESEINKLEDCLNDYQNRNDSIFESLDFFTKAFGFENIRLVSFYELSKMNDDKLRHLRIKYINSNEDDNRTKMKSFKKVLLEIWEATLNSYGYKYTSNDKLGSDYSFLKTVDGYEIGVCILKLLNIYSIKLKTQFKEVELFMLEGKINQFTYDNEYELISILKHSLQLIVNRGIEIIENDKLETFNLYEIYETIVDNYFSAYGYKRTRTDNNLLVGGWVIYKKERMEISFQHTPFFVGIGCFINKSGDKTNLYDLSKNQDTDRIYYQFRNKDEYVNIINKLLKQIQMVVFENK